MHARTHTHNPFMSNAMGCAVDATHFEQEKQQDRPQVISAIQTCVLSNFSLRFLFHFVDNYFMSSLQNVNKTWMMKQICIQFFSHFIFCVTLVCRIVLYPEKNNPETDITHRKIQ